MDASAFSRLHRVVRIAVISAIAVSAFQAGACGGMTDIGTEGTLDGGNGFGGSGNGTGVIPNPTGHCGNGVIDVGETCDGANWGNQSCNTMTMGARPYGNLICRACRLNANGCTSAGSGYGGYTTTGGAVGYAGYGNYPGTGGYLGYAGYPGYPGAGGYLGYAGYPGGYAGGTVAFTTAQCFAQGGVPDPGGNGACYTGYPLANNACYRTAQSQFGTPIYTSSYCGVGCGCNSCASTFAQCLGTPYCMGFLSCAANRCKSAADCYTQGCANYIDAEGGLGSSSVQVMDNTLTCMENSGCQISCPANNGADASVAR